MKALSAGWRPQSGAGRGGGMKAISAGWRPQCWSWGEEDGMKTISAGWRPQSGAGGRWDEDYISRLYTAVWGWGGEVG